MTHRKATTIVIPIRDVSAFREPTLEEILSELDRRGGHESRRCQPWRTPRAAWQGGQCEEDLGA